MASRRHPALLVPAVVVAGLVIGASQWFGVQADEEKAKTDLTVIARKLDAVLAGQQTILKKLDAITEDLRILKVRVTVRAHYEVSPVFT